MFCLKAKEPCLCMFEHTQAEFPPDSPSDCYISSWITDSVCKVYIIAHNHHLCIVPVFIKCVVPGTYEYQI